MGNYSELYFSDSNEVLPPGALEGSESPYLLAKYHVPILWLALFQPTDIVDKVIEGGETWPYLVKDKQEAATLLSSREEFLLSNFPFMRPEWLTQFNSLVLQTNLRYVHMDSSDVGTMDGDGPESWRSCLETMLSMFSVETPPKPTSLLGRLFRRTPTDPGLELSLCIGSSYRGKDGKQPWAYCGGSGTNEPMPWEAGLW